MKLQDTSSFKNFTGKEDIQMGLDLENTSSIMNLLRNNIYSDVVQSVVREIYSNAVDAHSKINSTDNIEIDLVEDGGKTLFSVRDFGLSMDKEAIANTYSKMGKSTKRDSNVQMGGWGQL